MGDHTFARLIKKRRDALGLSQARLAELVGRSPSTIRNWERASSRPSERSDVVALAAVLGLDEARVLEEAGFEAPVVEDRPTIEQAYASLTPEAPTRLPEPAGGPDGPEASEPADQVSGPTWTTDWPEPQAAASELEPEPDPEPEPEASVPEPEPAPEPEASVPVPEPDPEPELEASQPEPEAEVPVFDLPPRPIDPVPPRPWRGEMTDIDPAPAAQDRQLEAIARGRRRAAPPTVLEAAPAVEPSYIEDPDEIQNYRLRAVVTAVVILALVIVLMWSFRNARESLGEMWEQLVGSLDF